MSENIKVKLEMSLNEWKILVSTRKTPLQQDSARIDQCQCELIAEESETHEIRVSYQRRVNGKRLMRTPEL